MAPLAQFSLKGKTALVTGSASGIGAALARGFSASGAKVWITDILEAEGAKVAQKLSSRFVKADFTKVEEIEALAQAIHSESTKLDILVNNAGVSHPMSLEKMNLAEFDLDWAVNARAPVILTHRLLPLLKKSPGAAVINITSIHADTPHPGLLAYNMSKAALAMFSKSMAQELSPLGIRVNNLAPGAVDTEKNRNVIDGMGRDNFNQWIPLGRVAQTDDIVDVAIFLASDAARYISGANITVDGGYSHNLVRYRLNV